MGVRTRRHAVGILFAAAIASLPTPAAAQVAVPVFWNGGPGNWLQPGKWSPEPLDINNLLLLWPDNTLSSNFFLVFISSGSVQLGAPITITSLSLDDNAELHLSGIGSLTTELFLGTGSNVQNNGLITIQDSATLKTLALGGSGHVVLSDLAQLNGLAFNGSGHTIRGAGTLNSIAALDALVNQGTILADSPNDTLRVAGIGLINDALLSATNAGRLKIETPFLTNDDLILADGGTIDIDVVTFSHNDTLRAQNNGTLQYSSITANASGSLTEILAGSRLNIESSLLSSGTYRTVGTGLVHFNTGASRMSGNFTVQGNFLIDTGSLEIRNATLNAIGATFTATGNTVTLNAATLSAGIYTGAGTYSVTSPSTLSGLPDPAAIDTATFRVNPNTSLTLRGEIALNNGGKIQLVDQQFTTGGTIFIDGPVTLYGNGGSVEFGPLASFNPTKISPVNAGTLTTGPQTSLISPPSASGYLNLPLINHGTVAATGGYIELNTDTITNTGLLTASSDGRLQATRTGLPTLLINTGGILRAASGGTLTYSGATASTATLRGGTLDSPANSPGTHVNFSRLTLDGLTDGTLTLRTTDLITFGGARTTVLGTVTLDNATLSLRDNVFGPNTTPTLAPSGHSTVSGTGTILLGLSLIGSTPESLIEATGGSTFTFGPNVTVLVPPNSTGTMSGEFRNQGTIRGQSTSPLFITPTLLTNTGLVEADTGGTLDISRTQMTATILNTGGTLRARAGGVISLGNVIGQVPSTNLITGGTLDGTGTIQATGNVILDGLSTGPITVKDVTYNTYSLVRTTVTGTLLLDHSTLALRNTAFGSNTTPRLSASGNATISGTGTILLGLSLAGAGPESLVEAAAGTTFTFDPGVTVLLPPTSSGTLAGNFNNRGTIRSDSASSLFIFPTLLTNTGVVEAAANSRIDLALTQSTATVLNTGGILRAGPNATFNLSNNIGQVRSTTIITGGTFDGPAGGTSAGTGGTFANGGFVTLDGSADHPITIRNSTILTLGNTYTTILGNFHFDLGTFRVGDTNNGLATIEGTAFISGPVAFTGTGTLDFAAIGFGPHNAFLIPTDAASSLSLAAGISTTADSPADLGTLSAPLTNAGTIHASNSGRLEFLVPSLTHSGTAIASNLGRLTFGRTSLPTFIDNTSGSILATTSGTVAFGGTAGVAITTVRGGLLGGDSTGNFYSGGHTLLESTPEFPITLAQATFNINASAQLHLSGTFTLDNATILLKDTNFGTGNSPRLVASAPASLLGTGTLRFATNPTNGFPEATIETGPNSLTLGPGITLLAPAATQGVLTGHYISAGTFHAQGGTITLSASSLTNSGTIRTSSGGAITIGTAGTTITNTGGTFSSGAGTLIDFSGSGMTLTGGRLEGPGNFRIFGSLQLANTTLASTSVITQSSSTTTLQNTITLDNASLALQDNAFGANSFARLSAANHATVTGTGSILFLPNLQAGVPETIVSATTPNTSLTFGPNVTVATTGSNTAGTFEGTFRNEGTIHAPSGTTALNITHLTNRGLIHTSTGGSITSARPGLPSTFDNAGGTFRAGANTTITFTGSPTTITGGRLEGPGNFGFFGNVTLAGLQLKDTTAVTFQSSQTFLQNTITLDNASLALQDNAFGANSFARLSPANHATVTGTGSILFLPNLQAGTPETVLSATSPNTSLTFGPNVTVATTGSNTVGTFEGTFRNEGTIHAPSGTLAINITHLTNRGLIQTSTGGAITSARPGLPATFDNAGGTFRAGANTTITFTGSPTTVTGGTLQGPGNFGFFGNVTLANLQLKNTTAVTFQSSQTSLLGTLTLDNASLALQDNAFGGNSFARLSAADHATVTGTGSILFLPNLQAGTPETVLSATSPNTSLTFGKNITVTNTSVSSDGVLQGTFLNQGTIHANVGTLRLNSSLLINRGTIRSSAGSILIAQPTTPSIFENSGGTFLAGPNSTITFSGSNITLRSGRLTGPGNFDNNNFLLLDSPDADLIKIVSTTLRTTANSQTRLSGTLTLSDATLQLQDTAFGTGNPARLVTAGRAFIDGTGTLLLSPNPAGGPTENAVEALTGTLSLGPSIQLVVAPNVSGTLAGHIRIAGTLLSSTNTNLFALAGTRLTLTPTGSLTGVGTLTVAPSATFLNQGTISPGLLPLTPAPLTITGNLTNTPTSTLLFDLAGTTPISQYDQLTVNGTLLADGTLRVNLPGPYTPGPNTTFRILAATSISGTFDTFDLPPLSPGLNWNTSQLYSHGIISTFIVIPEPVVLPLAAAAPLLLNRRRR